MKKKLSTLSVEYLYQDISISSDQEYFTNNFLIFE